MDISTGLMQAIASGDLDPRLLRSLAKDVRSFIVATRDPDVRIGGVGNDAYMLRWWVIPRRKYDFNIYLHKFLRSDDDRALHDHPADNLSYIIEGEYIEHVPRFAQEPAGETIQIRRKAGEIAFRDASQAHRIELLPDTEAFQVGSSGRKLVEGALKPVWTLFFTGPKVREWGFHCPKGWKRWQDFTGQNEDNGPVRDAHVAASAGCGED